MHHVRRSLALAAAAGGLAIVPAVAAANGGEGGQATYRVTIENHAAGFQPLSPAGVAIHGPGADVWSVGAPASNAVAAIAEDANLPVFLGTYSATPHVSQVLQGGGGPIFPGDSVSFEFDARPGQRISLVSMLVNTNDAFTGLDSVVLGGGTSEYWTNAYDAGTEINNESGSHIPGPVGGNPFVRDPEGGVITHHPGVMGGADLLPGEHGWTDPVARIVVERI